MSLLDFMHGQMQNELINTLANSGQSEHEHTMRQLRMREVDALMHRLEAAQADVVNEPIFLS